MARLPPSCRVVVTGAGSGLGKALALLLAGRGARLLVTDLQAETAEATAAEARGRGAREAAARGCDVARIADVEALAADARERWGGVDLVINNAGVGVGGDVGETPLSDWQLAMNVNLWGVIHGCHVFAPLLRKQRSGHILNVASMAGLVYTAHMAPYNVTKAGVVALSETLHAELASSGVGVTVLCPGFFETNILRNARSVKAGYLRFAQGLTDRSSLGASDVARYALDAVERGELHALPMADGRWAWRIKRASPDAFQKLLVRARKRAELKESP